MASTFNNSNATHSYAGHLYFCFLRPALGHDDDIAHTLAGDIPFVADSLAPTAKTTDLNQIFLKADDILHIRPNYSPEEILVKKKPFQQWDRVRKSCGTR